MLLLSSYLATTAFTALAGAASLFVLFYLKGAAISQRTGIPWVSVLAMLNHRLHETIVGLSRRHGPVMMQYVGRVNLLVCDVDTVRFIVKEEASFVKELPSTSPSILRLWDANVFSSNGDEYLKHKRVVEPFFRPEALRVFCGKFLEMSKYFADKVVTLEGTDVDVSLWMTRFTMDVLGVTVLGVDLEAMTGRANEFACAINIYLREANNPVRVSHPRFEDLWFLECNKDLRFSIRVLEERINALIAKKKAARSGKKAEALDMFDLLIDALSDPNPAQRLTESNVFGNVLLMILAGHETTSTALTWCFYHLAQHPELQAKVHEEVERVLAGGPPTPDNIKELHYLSRFMKENLRLMPPAGLIPGRKCVEDIPIPGTSITLPKDAYVNYSIYAIHRDPKHWPEPDRFDPDRFLPENSKARHQYAYMPFSTGRRMCIGHQFSISEQLILLAVMVQRFKVLPVTREYRMKLGIMVAPEEMLVRFVMRK